MQRPWIITLPWPDAESCGSTTFACEVFAFALHLEDRVAYAILQSPRTPPRGVADPSAVRD